MQTIELAEFLTAAVVKLWHTVDGLYMCVGLSSSLLLLPVLINFDQLGICHHA